MRITYPHRRSRMLLSGLGYLTMMLFLGLPILLIAFVPGSVVAVILNLPIVIGVLAALVLTVGSITWYVYRKSLHQLLLNTSEVTYDDNPELAEVLDFIEGQAANREMETPKLHIHPEESVNAFAVGRRNNGHIVLYEGLLSNLETIDELNAIVTHELAHLDHRDTTYFTIFNGIRLMLMKIYFATGKILRTSSNIYGGVWESPERINRIVRKRMGYLYSPLSLFEYSMSRHREYMADAEAAKTVGVDPTRSVLRAIQESKHKKEMSVSSPSASLHVYWPRSGGLLSRLRSTHPPIEKRIKNLEKFE